MNKIKNKNIAVALVIVGIGLMCIGVLFLYNSVITNINKNDSNTSELSIDDYNKYYVKIQKESNYLDLNLADKYPINNIEKLDSKEKTLFVLQMISNYRDKEVTIEQLNQEMKKHFAKYNIYKKDIKGSSGNLLYKYDNNKFIYNSSDVKVCNSYTEELSNKANESNWILKKKVYYIKSAKTGDVVVNNVFSNIDDCNKNKHSLLSFEGGIMPTLKDDDYKKIKEKLYTYIYTFVRDDQIYKIKSIKVNK